MMRRIVFVVCLCICAAMAGATLRPATSGEQSTIQLPPPVTEGGRPLMDVLRDRQSKRDYSTKKLPPKILSNLLWAAWGVNRPETGFRTAPSAHNAQEVEIYLSMEEGLYLYDPFSNQLHRILSEDIREKTAIAPMWEGYASPAPLHMVYVADTDKMKKDFCYADTGFITQNVYLYCASEGLSTVVRGTLPPDLPQLLGLPENKFIVVAQTVGYNKYDHELYFPYSTTAGINQTELTLINTSSIHRLDGVLKAFDEKGQEQSSIGFEGTGYPIHLNPRERKELLIEEAFPRPDDIRYLIFFAESDKCTGYSKVYIEGRYRGAMPAVRKVSDGDIDLSCIPSRPDWWMRLALVNTTTMPTDATVSIELADKTTRSASVFFGPNEQQTFTLTDLFVGRDCEEITSGIIENASGLAGIELIGNGDMMGGLLLDEPPAKTIFFPHIPTNTTAWETVISVYNPFEGISTLTITAYDDFGAVMAVATVELDGKTIYRATPGEDQTVPLNAAWVKIEGTNDICGYAMINGRDNRRMARYNAIREAGKAGILPKLEKDGWTGIAIVNLENSEAVITLTAYNDKGRNIAAEIITLEGHGKLVDNAPGLFPGENVSEATYIVFQSDKNTVGLQINGSADGMMLDALPVAIATVETAEGAGSAGCLLCHEPHAGGGDNCVSCHESDGTEDDEEPADSCILCHKSHNGSNTDCIFCHMGVHADWNAGGSGDNWGWNNGGGSNNGGTTNDDCLLCHISHGDGNNCLSCHEPH